MKQFSFLAVFAVAALVPLVAADCCKSNRFNFCDDGTAGSPCCGWGKCNIFCCNCDGGCRNSGLDILLASNEVQHMHATDDTDRCVSQFTNADANGDGKLTFLEWATRDVGVQSQYPLAPLAIRWAKYDPEGKGYLTEDEAYSRRA